MSQPSARFTKTEVRRLVEGAKAAGLPVAGIRLDDAGLTILTEAQAAAATVEAETTDAEALRRVQELYGAVDG